MHATIGFHAPEAAPVQPIAEKVLFARELRKIGACWRARNFLAYTHQNGIEKPEIEQWTWPF